MHADGTRALRAAATSTSAPPSCRARPPPTSASRSRSTAPASRCCGSTTSRRIFHQHGQRDPRAGRRHRRDLARRDARAGRRVGQRQDDARAHAAGAARADAWHRRTRRACAAGARQALAEGRARAADRLPEPRLGAQPPPQRPADPAARAAPLGDLRGEAAEKRLRRAGLAEVRLAERYLSVRPGSALGRPQAARRDRARVRRQPAPGRLRRADLGARRLGAGGDPQPAGRAPGARAGRLPLHLPRPRRRALHLRPHRGALPRPADGARARRRSSSPVRTTPTPRRCSRRCRRSTAAAASGSSSRARSPAPPSRPAAASSTRAATASSATICERRRSRRSSRCEDGHLMRCHIPLEELRRLQRAEPASDGTRGQSPDAHPRAGARGDGRSAARRPGARAGAARARARCSCACTRAASATPTRTRSTASTPARCPAVLGHEGAGVVEAIGAGRDARRASATTWRSRGRPRAGECAECRRQLPAPVLDRVAGDGRWAGCSTATSRLSRDGETDLPLLLHLLVRPGLRPA